MELWIEEEARLGVTRPHGVLQNIQDPLGPQHLRRPLQPSDFSSVTGLLGSSVKQEDPDGVRTARASSDGSDDDEVSALAMPLTVSLNR